MVVSGPKRDFAGRRGWTMAMAWPQMRVARMECGLEKAQEGCYNGHSQSSSNADPLLSDGGPDHHLRASAATAW